MEDPATWDMLTASLAVTNLQRPSFVWAFLLIQGLVREGLANQTAFAEIVQRELDEGDITGPSVAARIAVSLQQRRIAHPSGEVPDPQAAVASARFAIVNGWSEHADSAPEVDGPDTQSDR